MTEGQPQGRFYNRKMETLPREEIRNIQWSGVKSMLERLYRDNPFYREHFRKAGITPDSINSLEEFSDQVPFLAKQDLVKDQEANPPFGGRLTIPPSDIRQVHTTSGTSGLGQEVYALDQEDAHWTGNSICYWAYAAGVDPGDISGLLWPVATMAGGQGAFESLRILGATPLILFIMDTKSKLNLMKRLSVHHFWATPSYLTRLTVVCEEMGIEPRRDLPRLKCVLLSTEAFPVEWALRMQEFWGATVHDLYGSTQLGCGYAYTCQKGVVPDGKRGCYHLLEHMALVEIVDPQTGKQVGYGEEGEPIITTFQRRGPPLVRFRSSDRVRLLPPEACDCGRTSNTWEAGTISRYDDMIKMKATNVWPQAVDEVLFARPEIEEYKGTVHLDEAGRERVKISIEFRQKNSDPLLKQTILSRLPEELKQRTGVTMEIEEVSPGTLPRFEYKSRRWTDERMKGLEQARVEKR